MQLSFDLLQTTAIGALVVFAGNALRRRFPFFRAYCIPGPVISGLLVSILLLMLKLTVGLHIEWTLTLKDFFMNVFFTCVGFSASARLLKQGGRNIMIGIAAAICGLVVLQDILGVLIAIPMGMHPLNGLMCSSVSTGGGVGTAAAIGPMFESLGAPDSTVLGVTAGTLGMVLASLVGGPVSRGLIRTKKLKPTDGALRDEDYRETPLSGSRLVLSWCLMILIGGIGSYLSWLLGMIPVIEMPYFIGCIFAGVIIRNIMEPAGIPYHEAEIGTVSEVCLDLFLALALMSIDLSKLLGSAAAMVAILAGQVVLIILWSRFCLRFCLGNDYNGAVMVAGLIGTGLGNGSNALANEKAVMEQFGPSQVAWVVFPAWSVIVVDIFNPVFVSLAAAPLARLGEALGF